MAGWFGWLNWLNGCCWSILLSGWLSLVSGQLSGSIFRLSRLINSVVD